MSAAHAAGVAASWASVSELEQSTTLTKQRVQCLIQWRAIVANVRVRRMSCVHAVDGKPGHIGEEPRLRCPYCVGSDLTTSAGDYKLRALALKMNKGVVVSRDVRIHTVLTEQRQEVANKVFLILHVIIMVRQMRGLRAKLMPRLTNCDATACRE